MNHEPLHEGDYTDRQVEAAHRVLVDVDQVLGSFGDAIVVVGGWVPDLIVPAPQTEHVGSIDVDLALDAQKLADGRYAELLRLLFDTGRYGRGEKTFQLVTAHAINGRDKPKDVYDLCFCLDEFPNAINVVADDWRSRPEDALVVQAIRILHEKCSSVDHYGPRRLALFHDSSDPDERAMQSRRAFELVQKLLSLL
jgi:hypothetical protein